jgi:phospholipase C
MSPRVTIRSVFYCRPSTSRNDSALSNASEQPRPLSRRANKNVSSENVAQIVNAIGTSQYWSNTAIFITWDDGGGWYDHVAPEIVNSYEYGFRVPLIVISP